MKASIRLSRFLVVGFAVLCLSLAFATSASAAWWMEIQSRIVPTNQAGVSLNITCAWDLGMVMAVLPIKVQSLTAGSFWTGSLPYDTTDSDGINYASGVTWYSSVAPWATLIREMRPGPFPVEGSGRSCGDADSNAYNGVSPDYLVMSTQGVNPLAAKPSGIVFATLQFNVSGVPGQFEFDTACFNGPLYKLFMMDNNYVDYGPTPGNNTATFNKGIVTLRVNGPGNDFPPVLQPIADQHVNVGDSLKFRISASDWDGTTPALTVLNLPNNATFVDSGNGAGALKFKPDSTQRGANWVRFIASDGDSTDVSRWVALVVVPPDGILAEETNIPTAYSLSQNYPNPFNVNTLIQFSLAETGPVKVEIFNILGRKIATPVDGVISPGTYTVSWNGKDTDGKSVSSGIYFYRLTTGTFTQVKKMVLMK